MADPHRTAFMARLFTILSTLNGAALAVTFLLGVLHKLDIGDVFLAHFTLGLFAAIGTLLVHCIIFTYFLGTGRWVKEVGLAYGLPDEGYPKLTRELKRRTFPPALFAMLITIATAAAGAGAQLQEWPWEAHATLAILTLVINVWAFSVERRDLVINLSAMDGVMAEVERIRAERGLPPSAEALRSQQ